MREYRQESSVVLDKPSKSQRKRDALALQELGETLVDLKPAQLDKMPLPEELREAVLAARQMNQRGARKRQLQYIGRLMREIEPEPIRVALGFANPLDRGPS